MSWWLRAWVLAASVGASCKRGCWLQAWSFCFFARCTAGKESIFTHSFANPNVIITCWLINKIMNKNCDFFFAKSINFYCKTSYRPPQHVLGRTVALLGRGLAELGEGGSSSMKKLYYIFNWKQIIICWGRGVAVLGRAVAVLGRAVAAPGEGPGCSYLIFWH